MTSIWVTAANLPADSSEVMQGINNGTKMGDHNRSIIYHIISYHKLLTITPGSSQTPLPPFLTKNIIKIYGSVNMYE